MHESQIFQQIILPPLSLRELLLDGIIAKRRDLADGTLDSDLRWLPLVIYS
jgi:hypothetical protein